jgi:hypothetical protein
LCVGFILTNTFVLHSLWQPSKVIHMDVKLTSYSLSKSIALSSLVKRTKMWWIFLGQFLRYGEYLQKHRWKQYIIRGSLFLVRLALSAVVCPQ